MKGIGWIMIGTAALLVFMFVGRATASDAAAMKLPVMRNDARPLNNYLAEVRQSGMVNLQTTDEPKRPPALDMDNIYQEEEAPTDRKSVFKAFAYSTIIPGAGQLYTGSKIKAAGFFAVEIAAWAGYITFHRKGNDRTDEFNVFADMYWSKDRYEDFIDANFPLSDPSIPGPRDDDSALDINNEPYFTHHLPDTETQQYYEMIGKYDQFVFGWDDVDPNVPRILDSLGTAYSRHREQYETMRHKANAMYGRATASLIVMMVNHVFSGVEAALAARNHNKKVKAGEEGLSFRAETATINRTSFPMLTMTYKF